MYIVASVLQAKLHCFYFKPLSSCKEKVLKAAICSNFYKLVEKQQPLILMQT